MSWKRNWMNCSNRQNERGDCFGNPLSFLGGYKLKGQVELLAPAGSYESFEAALAAGADAVYAGGASFGARAYAQNFSDEELLRAIEVAHLHGKKLYLTVNTLLKNRELTRSLYDYMAAFYEAGLDAAIVQDFGVLSFLKKEFPELPLHASTQMTVTGPKGMQFLESLEVSRVVPARELTLAEIAAMHEASSLEIETFIHGALCYSFSGQCLLSSVLGGRSGNRGRCAQPCRLPYEAKCRGERLIRKGISCPLSLKDICTIEILPEILEVGVTSLKIEGRMKQPSYTAGVTGMYRKYLDKLLKEGADSYEVEERDRQKLLEIYSRGGSCQGYYHMTQGPQMLAPDKEKKVGAQNTAALPALGKIGISGVLTLHCGETASLTVTCGRTFVTAQGDVVQEAKNHSVEESRIRAQMEKLGNTPYEWEDLKMILDENLFLPIKSLNELRRTALTLLEKALLDKERRSLPGRECERGKEFSKRKVVPKEMPAFYVSCEEKETAKRFLSEEGVTGIYAPADAMEECLSSNKFNKELYLLTPHITRGKLPEDFETQARKWLSHGMKGFLVRNLETYGAMKHLGLAGFCVADHSLYTWNNEAVDFWKKEGILRNTAPLELNEKELLHRDNEDSELLVYGYLPLMLSAQCVRKNLSLCTGDNECVSLTDRKGADFSVQCVCNPWKTQNTEKGKNCYNILYNSIPFGLLKEHRNVCALGMKGLRLSFTIEKPREAVNIFREFYGVYVKGREPSNQVFTKGHFKRGAE